MAEDKSVPIHEGYIPERIERGYRPIPIQNVPVEPDAGYQPTGAGDNPTNTPTPPKER